MQCCGGIQLHPWSKEHSLPSLPWELYSQNDVVTFQSWRTQGSLQRQHSYVFMLEVPRHWYTECFAAPCTLCVSLCLTIQRQCISTSLGAMPRYCAMVQLQRWSHASVQDVHRYSAGFVMISQWWGTKKTVLILKKMAPSCSLQLLPVCGQWYFQAHLLE